MALPRARLVDLEDICEVRWVVRWVPRLPPAWLTAVLRMAALAVLERVASVGAGAGGDFENDPGGDGVALAPATVKRFEVMGFCLLWVPTRLRTIGATLLMISLMGSTSETACLAVEVSSPWGPLSSSLKPSSSRSISSTVSTAALSVFFASIVASKFQKRTLF